MKLTKTQKVVGGTALGLGGLALAWFGVIRPLIRKKNSTTVANQLQQQGNATDAAAVKSASGGFPLHLGSIDANTNGSVSQLQRYIMSNYPDNQLQYHGADDGIFGKYTQADVINFVDGTGTVAKAYFDYLMANPTVVQVADASGVTASTSTSSTGG